MAPDKLCTPLKACEIMVSVIIARMGPAAEAKAKATMYGDCDI